MANQAIYGIVGSRAKAEKIIQALVDAGINSQEISLLAAQGEEFKEINHLEPNRNWRTEERISSYSASKPSQDANEMSDSTTNIKQPQGGLGTEKHTKAPEGATTGAVAGELLEGL